MSNADLTDRLFRHRTLRSLPQAEIQWIAAHGQVRQMSAGSVLTSKDGQVEGLHIILEGHLTIHVDRGAGRRKIMEWWGGDVAGLMPYSRLVSPPGDVVAEEPTEVLSIHRDLLPEVIQQCHALTEILVHVMVDRARHFTSSYLQDEKLVSLGKLAAGLAHELNNPASAIARSAGALAESLADTEAAARALGSIKLTPEQRRTAEQVRDACLQNSGCSVLSPLQQEERENTFAAWLEDHGATSDIADALAETDITREMLEQIASSVKGTALDTVLRWIAADGSARRLTGEIQQASSRIYNLVAAVKGFTQMDRESVPEPVAIGKGLTDTLAMLRAKAKSKSVGLRLDVPKDLPCVNGFAGELNQVWANLIDNALDAVAEGGQVELDASRVGDNVVVQVVDNGPGIPSDIQTRIFDPFFTTKPIGKGTGLGLDIVRRLVQRHNGQIEVDSKPGRTQFRVMFPIAQTQSENCR